MLSRATAQASGATPGCESDPKLRKAAEWRADYRSETRERIKAASSRRSMRKVFLLPTLRLPIRNLSFQSDAPTMVGCTIA